MNNLETDEPCEIRLFSFSDTVVEAYSEQAAILNEMYIFLHEPIETFTPISEPIIAPEMISFEINQFK